MITRELLSYEDLQHRWKPPGQTAEARRKWTLRRVADLGLRPTIPGRGRSVRFSYSSVLAAEDKQLNGRASWA